VATPAPPTAAAATCPSCKAPVAPGSKFCPACGASIAPAAPPPNPPVDIRNRVEEDRGALKRLQLLVPGFRGYREQEDLRAADSLLRIQVAERVSRARGSVEAGRTALTQAGRFDRLNDLAQIISDLQRLEGEIRHAEQGYTGISPAVRVNASVLDRLYEYDYGFASAADTLARGLDGLGPAIASGDAASIGPIVATARGQVAQLDSAFKARMRAIQGIQS
jgi:hypothetical protein